jgi:hypothetical protein
LGDLFVVQKHRHRSLFVVKKALVRLSGKKNNDAFRIVFSAGQEQYFCVASGRTEEEMEQVCVYLQENLTHFRGLIDEMRGQNVSMNRKKQILDKFFSFNAQVQVEVPKKGPVPVSEMTMDVRGIAGYCF